MLSSMDIIKSNKRLCAVLSHSVMSDSATPWTVALQAPLSMGFSRQEYWGGLPCPPPGIKSGSPALQAELLLSEPPGTWEKDN